MSKNKKSSYQKLREKQIKEAEKAAEELLPTLQKDKDWDLVTNDFDPSNGKNYGDLLRAVSRLTKKAVQLMHPDYAVSIRRGRGTGYGWISVKFTIPELKIRDLNSKEGRKKTQEGKRLCRKVKDVLVALNIRYSKYRTDYGSGPDTYEACLSVSVNEWM